MNESKSRTLNEFEKDCIVKRFEFTHETAWRLMKCYAEYQGRQDIGGSRDATRHAFDMGLITDAETWMDMIKWRNETAHNYNGEIAQEAISRIVNDFFPLMVAFLKRMEKLSTTSPTDMFL